MTKRICIVVENHPSAVMGGAQYQGHLLATRLAAKSDVEVTYLARRTALDTYSEEGLHYTVRCIGDDSGFRRRAVIFDAGDLTAALNEIRPHCIYQRMRQSYTAVCARYAMKEEVPFFFHIASEMDLDPIWASRGLYPGNAPFILLERATGVWGMRHATQIVAQSHRQARLVEERYGIRDALVIPNFQLIPDRLSPRREGTPLRVFWVANFKEIKRPELFVEVAERLADREDVEFRMAGRAPAQKFYQDLLRRIAGLRNLAYLGELNPEEVGREMQQAHVHVNTSRLEGFPNTFIEAWANGATILSLNVDPVDGGLEARKLGYVAGTTSRMAALLLEFANDPSLLNETAEHGFGYVSSNHSMKSAERLAAAIVDACV